MAYLLLVGTVSLTQANAASVALSNFTVFPPQAPKAVTVTGTVMVQNLDAANAVSVVVTFYDGGAPVANNANSPISIPAGGTVTVEMQFKTQANPPHCYSVSVKPGGATTGFCESGGGLLGGITAPVSKLSLMAPYVGLAAVIMAGVVIMAHRRRRRAR